MASEVATVSSEPQGEQWSAVCPSIDVNQSLIDACMDSLSTTRDIALTNSVAKHERPCEIFGQCGKKQHGIDFVNNPTAIQEWRACRGDVGIHDEASGMSHPLPEDMRQRACASLKVRLETALAEKRPGLVKQPVSADDNPWRWWVGGVVVLAATWRLSRGKWY
jgi:hypothetical protein